MKYCSNCGHEVNEQAAVCVHCGCNLQKPVAAGKKYCTACGNEVHPQAAVCVHCGCSIQSAVTGQADTSGMATLIKVLMVLSCIARGLYIIPLAWCIPMTISVFNSLKNGRPISTGMKVCTLLFVNPIAGICMLCMKDN